MKRTIYLPADLARQVDTYLDRHADSTLSALVQEALEERLRPHDPRGMLKLAGLVPTAATRARARAEDRHIGRER